MCTAHLTADAHPKELPATVFYRVTMKGQS